MANGFFVPMEDYRLLLDAAAERDAALQEVERLRGEVVIEAAAADRNQGEVQRLTAEVASLRAALREKETANSDMDVYVPLKPDPNRVTYRATRVASGDAGAHEPTSDQAGHSGASHQETGGPEPTECRYCGMVPGSPGMLIHPVCYDGEDHVFGRFIEAPVATPGPEPEEETP